MHGINQMKLPSLDEILECPPVTIAGIIAPVLDNIEMNEGDFPWLALADVGDFKARKHVTEQPELALQWAAVAVMIYTFLSQNVTGSAFCSIERKAMALRAELIRLLGHRDRDPVLDSAIIERWFFERNTLSLDDVLSIRDGKNRDSATLWQFDQLLERFRVLSKLLTAGHLTRCAELNQWNSAIASANASLA
jgi:hypothetical protein